MKARAPRKNFRFVELLAGMLLVILAASMGTIAVVWSYFTRQSIKELSNSIVQQTLGRIELRISSLLDQAQDQNAQTKLLIDGGQISIGDFSALSAYLVRSLNVSTNLSNLDVGLEKNGDFLFAERLSDGGIRLREYVEDETGKRVIKSWLMKNGTGELIDVTPADGYDPRARPWYTGAKAADKSVSTETYRFWRTNEKSEAPGVTYTTPIRDAKGNLVGVLSTDIDLEDMCEFLGEVRGKMSGIPFVMERRSNGILRLIAHPDPKMLPDPSKDSPDSLKDPAVAAFVNSNLSDLDQRASLASGDAVTFSSGGKSYFGSAHTLKIAGRLPWIVAVVIPVSDLMGGVYLNDQRAFWIGVASLGITALLAVRLARRVGKPLRQLTLEAQAIRRLQLNASEDLSSRITEVVDLANSMSEMKSSLKSFQKFVPVDIVRDIVSTGSEACLGGRAAPLTVFFSDITNFTGEAESMSPDALIEHIGEYLGAMSEAIEANGGTVDKFIGDGIMAFWGAPQPDALHATRACSAALEHQRVLAALCEKWRREGRPVLRARIGLHTGSAIVGNIGSASRLNYTAIGDTVNVASRIEGLNKDYGTEILISAACAEAAGEDIVTRPIENVSVKGRSGGIVVHELLAMRDGAPQSLLELARISAEAFEKYARADFQGAAAGYAGALAMNPNDPVAAAMLKRCAARNTPAPVLALS